jgi:hypothetical protein
MVNGEKMIACSNAAGSPLFPDICTHILETRLGLISRNSQAHSRLRAARRRLVMSVANSDIRSAAVENSSTGQV